MTRCNESDHRGVTERLSGSCCFSLHLSILPKLVSLLHTLNCTWLWYCVHLVGMSPISIALNMLTAVHTNGNICWLLLELFIFH